MRKKKISRISLAGSGLALCVGIMVSQGGCAMNDASKTDDMTEKQTPTAATTRTANSFLFPPDAFEGAMIWAPRDGWRGYNQPRGVNILYGEGEKHNRAVSKFTLESAPNGAATLAVSAVDDSAVGKCDIRILLNGETVFNGTSPFDNCANGRNMTGRKFASFKLPAGSLRSGENTLELINKTSCIDKNRLPWFAFDKIELRSNEKLKISVKTKADVAWGLKPLTVCLYPAQALEDTITGLARQPVQCTVTVRTGPDAAKLAGKDYAIGMEFPKGTRLEMYKKGAKLAKTGVSTWSIEKGKLKKFTKIGWLVRGTEQGFLIIAPNTPGKTYPVKTWISFKGDSKRHFVKTYKLKVAEAIKPRVKKSPFALNTWLRGGIVTKNPEVSKQMLAALKTLGVTSNWVGDDKETIRVLQDNGIDAIVQRNWYGADAIMVKKDKNAVAYHPDGTPDRARVRPMYQYSRGKLFDKKVLGGWRKDAKIAEAWACGTDFEGNAENISFDPETIKKFQEITGVKESDPKIIWEKYYPEWVRFRGWEASQIMRVASEDVKKVDPKKKWVVFSDAGDLSTYWWHKPIATNTAAISKFADMMCSSIYYYDNAGAIKTIDPYTKMILRAMPADKAAPTFIFMVYPIEFEYFGFLRQPAWSVKQSTVLMALNGIKTVSWFAGFQMDGVYLRALADAVNFIDEYYPVVEKGEMLPDLVDVKMKDVELKPGEAFYEVSGAPSFYDACRWMPGKEFWFTKVVWFYRDSRYVFLANHVAKDLTFDVKATGYTGRKWKVTLDGAKPKTIVKELDLGDKMWSDAFQVTVPAHEIVVIKMKRIE